MRFLLLSLILLQICMGYIVAGGPISSFLNHRFLNRNEHDHNRQLTNINEIENLLEQRRKELEFGHTSSSSSTALDGSRGYWKENQSGRRKKKQYRGIAGSIARFTSSNKNIPQLTTTNVIIGLNIFIYAITKGVMGAFGSPYRLNMLMKINRAIAGGQTYRLLTSCFCHGSPYHIAINSYSLYNMGPQAERLFGTGRFLFIYLMSGVGANYLTYLVNSSPYALGSSGCIFGLVGAFGTHYYRNKRFLGPGAQAGLQSIKQTLLINLFYGASMPGVDNGAHMAGCFMGAVLSYLIGPRLVMVPQVYGRSKVGERTVVPYRKMIRTFKEFFGYYIPENMKIKSPLSSINKGDDYDFSDDTMVDWV